MDAPPKKEAGAPGSTPADTVTINVANLPKRGASVNGSILISWVSNATDTATRETSVSTMLDEIRSQKTRAPIERIRKKFAAVMEQTLGDRKAAKRAVDADKKHLAAVLWSGTFSKRGNDYLLKHSGLLCADLDELGARVTEVRDKIKVSPHLLALFLSPTGDGLKAVFRVTADGDKHLASFRAAKKHVLELAGVCIDEACKDKARLCFTSHDPDLFLNEKAVVLPPLAEEKAKASTPPSSNGSADINERQRIAVELLGEIEWKSATEGYCTCPGINKHTTGNAKKDCIVYLDKVPTISCVHDHCSGIISGVNHELRSRIGKAEFVPGEESKGGSENTKKEPQPRKLPPIIDALELIESDLREPAEVVKGILHQGCKMVLGGASKAGKTWIQIELAVSVASGAAWWNFPTTQGRVLYLNFEIPAAFFKRRIETVCKARGIKLKSGTLSVWNLRGHSADIGALTAEIVAEMKEQGFVLCIIDPTYKLLGAGDENKAGDIAHLLNEFERIAVKTGAAIAFGAHYSKGNQASKESIDRIGGSGVFARDPDSILTLTKHEETNAFTVVPVLRNHPPVEPFCLRWKFPTMQRDESLDPSKLKKANTGRESKYSVQDLVDCLGKQDLKTGAFQKLACEETGMSRAQFYALRTDAVKRGLIHKDKTTETWEVVQKVQ